MAKKNVFKNKSLLKKIGIGAVAGVLGIGAIMGVGALLNKADEDTKTINPAYEIGALTENGAYLESKESIYTKEAFECQGLDIDLDFKSNVSYRVFFYNEDNNFLSATEKQTGNYDETSTPLIAKYARVLITPNDDDEIKWYEVNGYSRQLNIEVNKEQNFELINYFVVDEEKKNFMCSDSGEVGTEIKFLESDAYGVAKPIKCSGIKSFKFVFDEDSYVDDVVSYFYFTSNKLSITSGRITGDGLEFIVEVPNNAEYLYVNYLLGHEFTINQYS